jgi:abhydrolase domain-containing protein 12
VSILIAHAENDWELPISHSENLFEGLLSPIFPHVPPKSGSLTEEQWEENMERRRQLVIHTEIPHFGTMDECSWGGRKVVLLKTMEGGHNSVGELEGVQEIIRNMFFALS